MTLTRRGGRGLYKKAPVTQQNTGVLGRTTKIPLTSTQERLRPWLLLRQMPLPRAGGWSSSCLNSGPRLIFPSSEGSC